MKTDGTKPATERPDLWGDEYDNYKADGTLTGYRMKLAAKYPPIELREALTFYATCWDDEEMPTQALIDDCGQRARAALAVLGEQENLTQHGEDADCTRPPAAVPDDGYSPHIRHPRVTVG